MDFWCYSPLLSHDDYYIHSDKLANMAATMRTAGCVALTLPRVMNSTKKTEKLDHSK